MQGVEISGVIEPRQANDWEAASSAEFDEACASEHGDQQYYYCTADCAANCKQMDPNQTGLLVPQVLKADLLHCSSTHSKVSYGNDVCCCGEVWDAADRSRRTVPCEGEITAWNSCDAWCRLHSTHLGVGTAADCRPGVGWCFPYGLLVTIPDMNHQQDDEGNSESCSRIACSANQQCCCNASLYKV